MNEKKIHNFFSFMTYHQIFNTRNTTVATMEQKQPTLPFVIVVRLTLKALFALLRLTAFDYLIRIFKRALNMRQSRVRNPFQP